MIKRICLFLGLNILIVLTVSVLCDLLGLKPYITNAGLDLTSLGIFCFIWGMTGAFISLLLSKKIAKWMLKLKILKFDGTLTADERKIFRMVEDISAKAKITTMPEVATFKSNQCNAFATGASKNSALIAVSTALMDTLSDNELEAVIAHEMSHITNGDMVTMTLLQGVINSFVMFLSRVIAYALSGMGNRNGRRSGSPMSYFMFTILFEMIFLSLGSILIFYVSRKREFAADKGAATLVGKENMIAALHRLKPETAITRKELEKQKGFAAMMIRPQRKPRTSSPIFATHPSIEERIKALESLSREYSESFVTT